MTDRADLEIALEEKCVEFAHNSMYVSIKTDKVKKGWPDRLFFGPTARIFFVEFKLPGSKPRPKQWKIIVMLRSLGFHVHVVTDFERFKTLLSSHSYSISVPAGRET